MSQHDLTIANQGFPAFRADLNDALQALGSCQSGTSAPSPTFANQLWYDTTNNILKIRNEDNDAWISIATLDQIADSVSILSAATVNAGALNATGNTVLGDASTDTLNVGNGDLVKDASGNLGIGIATPSTKAHISSSTQAYPVRVQTTAGSTAGIEFEDPTTGSNRPNIASRGTALAFEANSAERMRIDSSGNVGIGLTSSPVASSTAEGVWLTPADGAVIANNGAVLSLNRSGTGGNDRINLDLYNSGTLRGGIGTLGAADGIYFTTGSTERMRIISSGSVLIGKTIGSLGTAGIVLASGGEVEITKSSDVPLSLNRLVNDGFLTIFYQDGVAEGNISVSGTTVSYNGGHLSRSAQTINSKNESLVKGTVLSNLDEMNEYIDTDGNIVPNEQLNKVKVSDIEGDVNVAGVFVNWSYDKAHNVDEINMAMTGDMIIRIAKSIIVKKGDLLISAGDGTAKPQSDDIVRSQTIAKVTSNHVTCIYEDGSYCVPCVLMAC